jgi:hypothetical protein
VLRRVLMGDLSRTIIKLLLHDQIFFICEMFFGRERFWTKLAFEQMHLKYKICQRKSGRVKGALTQ